MAFQADKLKFYTFKQQKYLLFGLFTFRVWRKQRFILVSINFIIIDHMNSLSQRSRILEHSRNLQTDRLYDPLRRALIELSKSKEKDSRDSRSSSLHSLQRSQVSTKVRIIDPVQAQYLIESIYIPTDSVLRPTKNIQKVEGKKFVAIQVTTKEGSPISQEQLNSRQHERQAGVEQTLFEMTQKQNRESLLYTPIKNESRIDSPEKPRSRSMITLHSKNKASQYTQSSLKKPEMGSNVIPFTNQYGLLSTPEREKQDRLGQTALMARPVSKFITDSPLNQQSSDDFLSSKKYINESPNGLTLLKQEQIQNLSKFALVSSEYGDKNHSSLARSSNFNSGGRLSRESMLNGYGRGLKTLGKKEKYRYNIFSSLDYAVNNRCQGCGANELIASKQKHEWG